MKLKRFTLILGLMFCVFSTALAQRTIKGVVSDGMNGEPLIGVSVKIENTTIGTLTDFDGKYQLTIRNENDVIEFSFVGMTSQKIKVGDKTTINVQLQPDNELDEVVVVGYGIVKKSDLTGSVSSLKTDELLKNNPVSIEQGMQGRLAGVNITRNDGAPGGGISMQIRGTNSFMSGTEPLYVIDGVPLYTNNSQETVGFDTDKDVYSRNALSFLDPSDIESIEVLKDGSSIAIYGAQGANGVVMITTKKGSAGKDRIEVNYSLGIANVAKRLDVLGARDYAQYRNESYINTANINGTYDPETSVLPFPGKENSEGEYKKGPDDFENDPYYWQDLIFQTAITHNTSIALTGGTKDFDYSVTGSLLDQTGVVINSNYSRKSLRFSLNKQLKPWLKFGTSTTLSTASSKLLKTATNNRNNGDEGVIRSALYYPPTYLVDENVTLGEYSTVANPKQYTEAPNRNKNYSVFTSNYINATIIEGLVYRMVLGYNLSYNSANRYFPSYLSEGRPVDGRSQAGDNTWHSMTWDNLLMLNKTFNSLHNVNATLGTSWNQASSYNKRVYTEGFGTDANGGIILQDGSKPGIPISSKAYYRDVSLILRAAYDYDKKYYATITGRYDGSSKFAKNHKYAFFPSVGLAWRASQESFLAENESLTNLKFRYSYGSSGNSGIGAYGSLALFQGANYPIGDGVSNGYAPDQYNPGNSDLKWETTFQHDAGIDISLFNRVDLTLDYYHKTTKDLIQRLEQPASTGIIHKLANLGEVRNTGWEFSLQTKIIDNKDFKWNIGFNFSRNKNEVLLVGEHDSDKVFPNELWNGLRPFVITKGKPIGQIYGFVEDGIWNTREDVIASKQFQTQVITSGTPYTVNDNDPVIEKIIAQKWVGEIRYVDNDDSGTITDDDQDYIGDVNPKFTYGLNMNFSYRNFDFSFLFNGVSGNDILNMSSLRFHDIGNTRNILKSVYDNRWTPEKYGTNPKNYYDSSRSLRFSRRYVEDGSYLKLRNVTLGYTFNKPFKGVNSIRITATGNNLFTITDYTGYDPEVNSFGSEPAMRGIDAGGYPQSREFIFGVNLNF